MRSATLASSCSRVWTGLKEDSVVGSMLSTALAMSHATMEASGNVSESKKKKERKSTTLKLVTEFESARDVSDEPFYHGYMTSEEAAKLLRKHGRFLLRKTGLGKDERYVLSVSWQNIVLHYLILQTRNNNYYWLYGYCSPTVGGLIRLHQHRHLPVSAAGVEIHSFIRRQEWQLYHEQVVIMKELGTGAFGVVCQGLLTMGIFSGQIPVAVKTLSEESSLSPDERIKFLREANLMLKIRHPNIVRLYGVCSQKEPIMIVMELLVGGNMLDRVRNEKSRPSADDRIRYSIDIVRGMAYLEREEIIHRDLAARNCLLDANDMVKISDFGLSLWGRVHREKQMKKVPIRWLPPETLRFGYYSTKSDVYAFGVTLWEIYAHGMSPFSEYDDLRQLRLKIIKEGLKLTPPHGTPSEMAEMMKSCWHTEAAERPSFKTLKDKMCLLRRKTAAEWLRALRY